MAEKILKILQDFFSSMGLINLGITIVFIFYGRHMCCDKDGDVFIYGAITLGCLIAYIILGIINIWMEEK